MTDWRGTGQGAYIITYKFDNGQKIDVGGIGQNKKLFYDATQLPTLNSNGSYASSPCETMYPNLTGDVQYGEPGKVCFPHNPNITGKNGISITNMEITSKTITTEAILIGLGMDKEASVAKNNPANPGLAVANSRKNDDPVIDPKNITDAPPNGLGKTFLTLSDLGAQSPLTLAAVNSWYDKYPITDENNRKYYNDGHLLVKIDKNIEFAATTETFKNKIAFVVDGQNMTDASISGKFFDSDMSENSNASTLIYVGEHGRLNNFGCENGFRGLIYVDEKNEDWNQQTTFKWGPNSTVEGAVLLKGKGRVNWHSGHTTIRKNNDILNGFANFINSDPNSPKTDETAKLEDESKPIRITPIGYYHGLK